MSLTSPPGAPDLTPSVPSAAAAEPQRSDPLAATEDDMKPTSETVPGQAPEAVAGEGPEPLVSEPPATEASLHLDAAAVPSGVVPPPPAWEPSVSFATTAIHFGPVGKRRSPLVVVLLSVLTLGIYALVWHRRVNREIVDFDPRLSVHLGRTTWAVAIPWLLGWLVAAAAAARILAVVVAGRHVDVGIPESLTQYGVLAPLAIPYLVLVLPFAAVAVVMTAERIRVLEDRVDILGSEQLRPAAMLAWLLLPVVGGLVLLAQLQGRLNRVWSRVGVS
jgi:hypothetical protein